MFVLVQKGKIGAVQIEEAETSFKLEIIAECKYDTLETFNHDLLFSNENGTRYYNSTTKTIFDFKDVRAEYPCLYCKDETYQYIIHGETGEIIYKKEYTSYSESCFCYCGDTDKGFVFYDARYSTYLYPAENGYKCYDGLFNHPVIVNRRNIVNISEGNNGLGIIDSYGNSIFESKYDCVDVELKVTAIRGREKIKKIIPIIHNTFGNGEVSEIETWI